MSSKSTLDAILSGTPADFAKTKIICTLGPKSRDVPILEELLRSGMSVARFNFSHGTHEYHQETLDNLRTAMENTRIMCAVMLDTKGPEIRTGFLKDECNPLRVTAGQQITVTTDYARKGDATTIAVSYEALARDVQPGAQILIADGSLVLKVKSTDMASGTVVAEALNGATIGERKNVNLPGVVVDLPTVTDKDIEDIRGWAVPNLVDFIAASFVERGQTLTPFATCLEATEHPFRSFPSLRTRKGS